MKSKTNLMQCGNTPAHCGTGCVSGCTSSSSSVVSAAAAPSASSAAPRSDGRCGKDFGGATCDPAGAYGGCCSEYGYASLVLLVSSTNIIPQLLRLNYRSLSSFQWMPEWLHRICHFCLCACLERNSTLVDHFGRTSPWQAVLGRFFRRLCIHCKGYHRRFLWCQLWRHCLRRLATGSLLFHVWILRKHVSFDF